MISNAQRGAYYKAKTKRWLEGKGYQVADLELVRWVYPPDRKPFPVKRDQFASDLLAVSAKRIVFVQCKGGGASVTGGTFPEAQRKFAQYTFPWFVERWIVAWPHGSRVPRLLMIERTRPHGEASEQAQVEAVSEEVATYGCASGDGGPCHSRARQRRGGLRGHSRSAHGV